MNYRFSILAAVAMLCSLAMTTACTKDDADNFPEGSLEIFAEGAGLSTKTTVNGTSVKWVDEDKVWINGATGTVRHYGDHWYAAKDGGGYFVTSSEFNSFYPAAIATATGTGSKTVTVYFSTPVALAVNAGKTVQVPVIPSSSDLGEVTIRVYTHLAPVAYGSMEVFTFEKNKSSFGALGRNEVKSSPEIGIVRGGANVTPSVKGAFSVSRTTRVMFSKGNLQYQGSTGTWRFATNQYDCIGNNAGNTAPSASQTEWIDLFGWGTGNAPNQTSTTDADYGTFYDWGNNIGGGWRTLSSEEMNYLLNTRSNTTFNLPYSTANIRYTKATVNDKNGLIIFPDNYVHPTGVTITGTLAYNTADADYSTFTVSSSDWTLMQAAGAVFLPAAGYRDGTSAPSEVASHGYYWLSSESESHKAYRLLFHSEETTASNPQERHYGFSVRLVMEAN